MSGTWTPKHPPMHFQNFETDETQGFSNAPVHPIPSSQGWPTDAFRHPPSAARAAPDQRQLEAPRQFFDDGLEDFDHTVRDYTPSRAEDPKSYINNFTPTVDPTYLELYGMHGYTNTARVHSSVLEPRYASPPRYNWEETYSSLVTQRPTSYKENFPTEEAHASPPSKPSLVYPVRSRAVSHREISSIPQRATYVSSSSPAASTVSRKEEAIFGGLGTAASSVPESSRIMDLADHPSSSFATPIIQGIPLVSVRQALPERLRSIFPFDMFNAVQSKCFSTVYNTNDNVVVAAPTGSGKTMILELAICKLALERGNENFKIVYQAPTKALCSQRARDWEKKFSHMFLKCAELTGDTSQAEMRRVGDASIIVTTPEKWDSITRKWHDHRKLLQLVELFLIDEVHILKDVRGATLEAVVSRMKAIGTNVRFIALSATVPNANDIATWLGRNHTNQQLPAHHETFSEDFRPVKLEKFVYSYEGRSDNDFAFEKILDSKLTAVLARHACQKPILIFCFTRKSCESTAALLAEYVSRQPGVDKLWPMPSKRIPVINGELQEVVKFGVAFHHAGLGVQDRNAVEQHFLNGQLGVICCTSTLAVGVNLPCHTAVLKGTVGFVDGKSQELSDLEVMQMLGRAGRPQFDDNATAIILTRTSGKARYERMVSGKEVLESTLHLNLIEHLNSEVCLGTICDLPSAKMWLTGTFLNVRLRRNPGHYQLTSDISNPSLIDEQLEEICQSDIKLLQEAELVTDGQTFRCTDYGRAMSRYMVEFTTMRSLLQIPKRAGMETLITIMSHASEFREFRMKPPERALFRDINQSPFVMYPLMEAVTQTWHKVFLLVQAHLGHIQYADTNEGNNLRGQLTMEKIMIFERMQRLVRAVIDCKGHDRDAAGVRTALELARALAAESWEGRATQLTQVPNIGPAGMRKLASKGIRTVQELADKEPHEIERLMSRQSPFGKKMKEDLEAFPRLSLNLAASGHKLQPWRKHEPATINACATIRYLNRRTAPRWLGKSPLLTFLAESDDGTLVYFWRGSLKKVDKIDGLQIKFSRSLQSASDRIICHLSCEEVVGTAVTRVLQHGVPTSAFPSAPLHKTLSPAAQITKNDSQDYMGNDGVEDSDLIEAAERAIALASSLGHGGQSTATGSKEQHYGADDLEAESLQQGTKQRHEPSREADDDREEDCEHSVVDHEPVQLPNGKWRCNHACSGKARTKSGKPCIHKCCKEGLDKPRKKSLPKPKKRTADEMAVSDTIEAVPAYTNAPDSRPAADTQAKRPKPAAQEPQATDISPPGKPAEEPRARSNPVRTNSKYPWKKANLGNFVVDCIDLSNVDEPEPSSLVHKETPVIKGTPTPKDVSRGNVSNPLRGVGSADTGSRSQDRTVKHQSLGFAQASFAGRPALAPIALSGSPGLPFSDVMELDYLDEIVLAQIKSRSNPVFRDDGKDEILYQADRKTPGWEHDGSFELTFERLTAPKPVVAEERQQEPERLPSGSPEGRGQPATSQVPGSSGSSTRDVAAKDVDVVPRTVQENEPGWLSEFDPEFLDLFSGHVDFV